MAALDTLITPLEIRLNGLVGAQMDTTQMQSLIVVIEERLFNEYFGIEFYATLLADKATYAAMLFAANTVYNAGDYVKLNGLIYLVTQTTTGAQIPAQNPDYFELAPKFTTPANEYIWLRYLSRLLSQSVANEFVIPSAIKQTEKGLIRLKDEASFNPASAAEIATFKESNYQLIKATISVMEAYIMANSASYPTYKRVQEQASTCSNADAKTADKYRRNTLGIVLPDCDNWDDVCDVPYS